MKTSPRVIRVVVTESIEQVRIIYANVTTVPAKKRTITVPNPVASGKRPARRSRAKPA